MLAVSLDECLLLRRQLLHPYNPDALLSQIRPQSMVPAAILIAHDSWVRRATSCASSCWGKGRLDRDPSGRPQCAASDHQLESQELVEVAGSDGKKLHTFEQRVARVLGFLQHTAVEGKPGRFAIQHQGRVIQGNGGPYSSVTGSSSMNEVARRLHQRQCFRYGKWENGSGDATPWARLECTHGFPLRETT